MLRALCFGIKSYRHIGLVKSLVPAWSNGLHARVAMLVVDSGVAQNFRHVEVFGRKAKNDS
jgi:hypothetical protein